MPTGQPPPGSWEESAACPVSTQRVPACASCDARQSEGCKDSGAAGTDEPEDEPEDEPGTDGKFDEQFMIFQQNTV